MAGGKEAPPGAAVSMDIHSMSVVCSTLIIRAYRICSLISRLLIKLNARTMPFPTSSPSVSPYSTSSSTLSARWSFETLSGSCHVP